MKTSYKEQHMNKNGLRSSDRGLEYICLENFYKKIYNFFYQNSIYNDKFNGDQSVRVSILSVI